MKALNIIVIGAGMGGLSAAVALRQAGHHVEVFDRVSELRPAGAAISVWSNGIKVLDRLGLGEAIEVAGGQMERMAYYRKDGSPLTDFSLAPLYAQVAQRAYSIARTELQRILLDATGEEHVQLGSAASTSSRARRTSPPASRMAVAQRAICLSSPTAPTRSCATRWSAFTSSAYDGVRCERVADIITRARKRAETIHGKEPQQTQRWYEELAAENGRHIMDGMSKTILSGPLG